MAINQPTESEVELEIAERAVATAKYEAYMVLMNPNTDAGKAFKTLILDGYLKDKAVEFTSLLAVPSMKQYRGDIFEGLAAISHFEEYLHMVDALGAPVEEDVDEE